MGLARAYKQINAPVGDFGQATLRISTQALASSAPNDSTYNHLGGALADLTSQRDSLAGQMIQLLHGAEFNGQRIDGHQADELVGEADLLLLEIQLLELAAGR